MVDKTGSLKVEKFANRIFCWELRVGKLNKKSCITVGNELPTSNPELYYNCVPELNSVQLFESRKTECAFYLPT